jgi:LysR family glycine cleavage system transcriptional activator
MNKRGFHDLPLEWIRAFEAAGRLGSFTAAAQETGLTQAAISQRIGHLERQLGTRLFVRTARGVSLSVEGEAWLPYVSEALRTLRDSSQDLFGARAGKITITASASVTQLWLAPRLSGLPDDIEISFASMVLQSDFQPKEAGIEIRYGLGDWPNRYAARLFDEALSPVAAQVERDWQTLPRLGVSGPRAGWQDWARQTGGSATPIPHLRFDSYAGALAAATHGAGVLLASLPLTQAALDAGKVHRLSDQVLRPEATYWMCADRATITKRQWDRLCAAFCQTAP